MSTRIDCFSAPAPDGREPVNAWIVGDDEEVIVIDPGRDAAGLLDAVGDREVLAVICTHGHAAHVAAAFEVAERDEAPVALHPRDRSLWRESHPGEDADIAMEDGGVFEVADVALEVIHAPATRPARCACTARTSARCSPGTCCWPAERRPRTASSPTSPGRSTRSGRTC
jgi:glyoxylase-like metal-dependent hydrolase (beta-lactamase superfamily II)